MSYLHRHRWGIASLLIVLADIWGLLPPYLHHHPKAVQTIVLAAMAVEVALIWGEIRRFMRSFLWKKQS